MGRIVANFFISLDGVVESPHEWHFPYLDDEMGAVVGSGMETQGAFLLGRHLYDEWSDYFPGQGDDVPFASYINNLPKYVLTSHPVEGEFWNATTVIDHDHEDAVRRLKETTDSDIGMSGCATTVRWLIAHDLLDELALLLHPIAVGKGQRLFEDSGTIPLRLTESRTLATGVLLLRYAPG
jgi:dihydrofolate reductase